MIVFGSMEATLTPLMEAVERAFAGIKVFSLPSVDHPEWGRHIELGVKGDRRRSTPPMRACARALDASAVQARPRIGALAVAERTGARCALPHRNGDLRRGGDWHAFC